MAVAVIIDRIQSALVADELQRVPDAAGFKQVSVMGDLLQPWEEVFPGVDLNEENDTTDIFAWGGLRKPKLTPQLRLNPRPLPAPRLVAPPPKFISPGLFASVRGIWDFYLLKGPMHRDLLSVPFDPSGLGKFTAPLWDAVSDYYPLGIFLEQLGYDEPERELRGISLLLPHYTYEDECVGVFEAFLSGTSGIHSLIVHSFDPKTQLEIELPPKDLELIETLGWEKLVEDYAASSGTKSYDLEALENFGETYFDTLWQRYPKHAERNYDIITDDPGMYCEVVIECREDIEFCLEYSEAYEKLLSDLPDLSDMDNNHGGVTETFMHEICEVWRKANGRRSVKWTSPKAARLSYRFKKEKL